MVTVDYATGWEGVGDVPPPSRLPHCRTYPPLEADQRVVENTYSNLLDSRYPLRYPLDRPVCLLEP